MSTKYFATCARGLEEVLEEEAKAIGAEKTEKAAGGVYFFGDQDTLYKAHLWFRTANRILLPLRSFRVDSADDLYENLLKFKWETFLKKGLTFAVDCTLSGRNGPQLQHSQYAKLRSKDAIVDRMREKTGDRPNVDVDNPDFRAVIYVRDNTAFLNLDASGASLHERGYRAPGAEAPLKETLAAGLLKLSGWDGATPILDPMCGSGTLLAEAALIATNTAPGLFREKFLFHNWPDFYLPRWEQWKAEALAARQDLPADFLRGFDHSSVAVDQCKKTFQRLKLPVSVEQKNFTSFERPIDWEKGFIIINPPYGERIGEEEELVPLYKLMGDTFKKKLKGWKGAVFTGSSLLAKSVGLRPTRRIPLWNGPIECRLLTYDMY